MASPAFVTPLDRVVVPRAVYVRDGLWATQTPVLDASADRLFAHLMPVGAGVIAARSGGRLPTAAEVLAIHERAEILGTELEPFTLPDAYYRAKGYAPGCGEMVTEEWCQYHDDHVVGLMAAQLGDLGDRIVANAGKHWTQPLGSLCGWWVSNVHAFDPSRWGPGFVQAGGHVVHSPGVIDAGGVQESGTGHSDYATTTIIVFDTPPGGAS